MQTSNLDYFQNTHKESVPLSTKEKFVGETNGAEQLSACEDCTEEYANGKTQASNSTSDYCNLSFSKSKINYIGDLDLLNSHKIGFLSSQKNNQDTINKIIEWAKIIAENACIISGFQSTNESKLLDLLLKNNKKIIMVLSREIYDKCPTKYKNAVGSGQMLIISPFNNMRKITTRDNAKIRNKFVIEASNEIVIGDLTEGGMLDNMLKGKTFNLLGERTEQKTKPQ